MTGSKFSLLVLNVGGIDGKAKVYASCKKLMHVFQGETWSLEMETKFLGVLRPTHFFFLPHLI